MESGGAFFLFFVVCTVLLRRRSKKTAHTRDGAKVHQGRFREVNIEKMTLIPKKGTTLPKIGKLFK